jgi:NitT/TauT family transport system substrate-binding protein
MKKTLSLLLCAALMLSTLAGCGKTTPTATSSTSEGAGSSDTSSVTEPDTSGSENAPNFTVLSGPTGVGAAKLLYDQETAASDGSGVKIISDFSIESDNQTVTASLINGDTDIAAIATNVAANLFAKSDGGIQVLAVNTLGVLYILEKGDTIRSMGDLRGKTLYAPSTGKGANPEYVLNYLLEQNDVSPDQVDIQWMTPQEITATMMSGDSGICMLPVPAATALLVQDSGVRQALSLSDEWDNLGKGSLAMGCVVARTEYIEENPQGVEAFLTAYEQSIAYMSDEANLEEAAQLVAQYEITPNAAIAAAAIPQCNLTFLTGSDMKQVLEQYYQVLYQADPDSIGGSMPYDSFYYGVE